MIQNSDSTAGVTHRLIPKFNDPYEIRKGLRIDRYVAADIEGFQLTRKPYQGVWKPANMRLWRTSAAEYVENVKNELQAKCKDQIAFLRRQDRGRPHVKSGRIIREYRLYRAFRYTRPMRMRRYIGTGGKR